MRPLLSFHAKGYVLFFGLPVRRGRKGNSNMKLLDRNAANAITVRRLIGSFCFALFVGADFLALTACAKPPPSGIYYASGEGVVTPDGLHRVKWEPFQIIFLRPGARLGDYRKLIIDPLTIAYAKNPDPAKTGERGFGSYEPMDPNYRLPNSALELMKRVYLEFLTRQLIETGRFEATESEGEGVLRIRGHISDLVVSAQPMVDQPPDGTAFVGQSGHMVLSIDVLNTATGAALMRVADGKEIRGEHEFYASEGVSQSGAIRSIFGTWADDLRWEIERLSALSRIPAPGG